MTTDPSESDIEQSDANDRGTSHFLSRRAVIGLGGAVGGAGILTWVLAPEFLDAEEASEEPKEPDQEPTTTSEAEKPSLWDRENQAIEQTRDHRPSLRPSFEYASITAEADDDTSGQIEAIGADPAEDATGDRIVLSVAPSAAPNLETLLVARFTTGESLSTRTVIIAETSITFRIYRRADLWLGVARFKAPELESSTELLIARADSQEGIRTVIDGFPDRYEAIRPL